MIRERNCNDEKEDGRISAMKKRRGEENFNIKKKKRGRKNSTRKQNSKGGIAGTKKDTKKGNTIDLKKPEMEFQRQKKQLKVRQKIAVKGDRMKEIPTAGGKNGTRTREKKYQQQEQQVGIEPPLKYELLFKISSIFF